MMKLLLRNMLSFFGENKGHTALYALSVVLIVILECILPLVLKIVVDYIIIPRDYGLFSLLILGFAVTVVLYASSMLLMSSVYAKLYAKVFLRYNHRLFHKIQQLSMSYFFQTRPGQVLSHFTSDLESIETLYKIAVPACIFAVLKIIANTVIAFALDWRLAALSMIGLAVTLLGPYPLDKKAPPVNNSLKNSKAQLLSVSEESISAQLVVKSFNMQKIMGELFSKKARERARHDARAFWIGDMIQNSRLIFFTISALALLGAGSYLAMQGSITVGTVIAFFSLFSAFGTSIGYLAANLRVLADSGVSVRRLADFLDTAPAVCDADNAVEVSAFHTGIAFEDVLFGYKENEPTLKNISLFIPQGSLVAFVGPSGSGKSSVLNLLLRFYDVQKGGITIDGHDVRRIRQHSLHRLINIVLQENFLFNTTILENLRYAKPEAGMEEIVAAAKAAEIHDFISGLPDGYQTMVGERGNQLSGGQRQRLALARALLCRPAILLLDEATSALDPRTEASINQTLLQVARERTLISVTHRLSSVKDYDRIIVMDQGRVAECGSHQELLQKQGIYSSLWEKQYGFVVDDSMQYAEITAERLAKLPLFQRLDHKLLQMMADLFVSEQFAAERTLIYEGDYGDKFYVLVRGQVAVFKKLADGTEKRLAVLQDGDHFGEIALLRNIPRTATVRARTPCLVLSLQREKFSRVLETAPAVKKALEEEAELRFQGQS